MADKTISELTEATQIQNNDLFVLEQDSQAKKIAGSTMLNSFSTALGGHGGISGITLQSTSGMVKTYRITYTDGTYYDFQVIDGTAITFADSQSDGNVIISFGS